MKIPSLTKIAGIIGSLTVIGGTAWAVGEYTGVRPVILKEFQVVMDQVQQNTNSINLARFLYLNAKREHATLTVEEAQERCQLAAALNWKSVEGCQ